jgi:hypothetical protein
MMDNREFNENDLSRRPRLRKFILQFRDDPVERAEILRRAGPVAPKILEQMNRAIAEYEEQGLLPKKNTP